MAFGTKTRQQQPAEVHLRENHQRQLALVEEFIVEIEGTGKAHDVSKLEQFADASWRNDGSFARVIRADPHSPERIGSRRKRDEPVTRF